MKVFYTDHFVLPLPDGHRFPMRKYSMLREAVQAFAPQTLEEAPAARDDELLLAHDAAYVARMSNGTLTANNPNNNLDKLLPVNEPIRCNTHQDTLNIIPIFVQHIVILTYIGLSW